MQTFATALHRKLASLEEQQQRQSFLEKIEDRLDACVAAVLDCCSGPMDEYLSNVKVVQVFKSQPTMQLMPVVAVGTIMGTLYVSFSWAYLPAVGASLTSTSSVIFHSAFVLAGLSYERGLTVDPGRIPDDWQKDEEGKPLFESRGGRQVFIHERKRKGGALRFCNKEQRFKPDRAHYCSAMQRNVLRMDHYCPWMVNCVGYHNQKYFILFLFYTVLASFTADAEAIRALFFGTFSGGYTFMMFQGTVISTLLTGVLGPFLSFHCWLMANNMTTIEYCEKKRDREQSANPQKSPYDLGLYKNIQCIMGDQWPLWLLPICGPSGDGLQWGIAEAKEATSSDAPAVAAESSSGGAGSRSAAEVTSDSSCSSIWIAAGSMGLQALQRSAAMEMIPSFLSKAWQGLEEIRQDLTGVALKQAPRILESCWEPRVGNMQSLQTVIPRNRDWSGG